MGLLRNVLAAKFLAFFSLRALVMGLSMRVAFLYLLLSLFALPGGDVCGCLLFFPLIPRVCCGRFGLVSALVWGVLLGFFCDYKNSLYNLRFAHTPSKVIPTSSQKRNRRFDGCMGTLSARTIGRETMRRRRRSKLIYTHSP